MNTATRGPASRHATTGLGGVDLFDDVGESALFLSQAGNVLLVRRWWEEALNGDESVGLPWIVLSGFLRIATNPRVCPEPLPTDEALAKVDAWLSSGTVSVIVEKPNHWRVLRGFLIHRPRLDERALAEAGSGFMEAGCRRTIG